MPPISTMPLVPFQRWLNRKVELHGVRGVARIIGVDDARVRCIQRGAYQTHGRRREMGYLTFQLVDRWATAFGDHYLDIYPEGHMRYEPTTSIFRAKRWKDREHCGFGGPHCHVRPASGRRFCDEHTELFARIREQLGNAAPSFNHETGWERQEKEAA